MRCLFCDKKLSLLKLAKGDSFCSPQHFDAYQLQRSKNDFERLMGLPVGDAPKPPLVTNPREEAPLRTRPDDPKTEPERQLETERIPEAPAAFKTPPYAAFARSPVPPSPPEASAPVVHEILANVTNDLLRDPAFPVHSLDVTTGVFNLHHQLQQGAIAASEWAPPLDLTVNPEEFPSGIQRPSPELSPDPGEPHPGEMDDASLAEAAASTVEAAAIIEPALPIEIATTPEPQWTAEPAELGEPPFAVQPASFIDLGAAIEPALPVEVASNAEPDWSAESQKPVKPSLAVEPASSLEVAAIVEPDSLLDAPSDPEPVEPVLAEETSTPFERPAPVRQMPDGPRISFVLAPSFTERSGTAPLLNGDASSTPKHFDLAPQMRHSGWTESKSHGTVAPSTRFAEIAELQSRDCFAKRLEVGTELPLQTNFIFPSAKSTMRVQGWHASGSLIELTLDILETAYRGTAAVTFDLARPASLMIRPEAMLPQGLGLSHVWLSQPPIFSILLPFPGNLDPSRECPRSLPPARLSPRAVGASTPEKRSIDKCSPLLSGLKMDAPGREAAVFDHPACATGFSWRTIRSTGPAMEPLSEANWKNPASPYSVPVSIADRAEAPIFALESLHVAQACIKKNARAVPRPSLAHSPSYPMAWRNFDSTRPPSPQPKPVITRAALCFASPAGVSGSPQLPGSTMLLVESQRAFAMAPNVLFQEPALPASSPARLPDLAGSPAGTVRMGLGPGLVSWEPHRPDSPCTKPVKLLPVRGGPVLPAARSWPRLGALPR